MTGGPWEEATEMYVSSTGGHLEEAKQVYGSSSWAGVCAGGQLDGLPGCRAARPRRRNAAERSRIVAELARGEERLLHGRAARTRWRGPGELALLCLAGREGFGTVRGAGAWAQG